MDKKTKFIFVVMVLSGIAFILTNIFFKIRQLYTY